MIAYFDMDGVLTNLRKFLEDHRKDEPLDWDGLGLVIQRICEEQGHKYLFEDLPPNRLEEMKAVMIKLHEMGFKVEILTSLGIKNHADLSAAQRHEGKVLWLRKYYADLLESGVLSRVNVVCNCEQKRFYSRWGALLLDDMSSNIEQFSLRGGIGIQYSISEHGENISKLLTVAKVVSEIGYAENPNNRWEMT